MAHETGLNRCLANQESYAEGGNEMTNSLGKRYICAQCGAEYIVTRGGDGKLTCCNEAMVLKS